jgi:transposase
MRQQHRAGEKLFTDFAGPMVSILDPEVGIAFEASIFVAVLGASNYTYACATRGQTTADWIGGMVGAMKFIGGVPELLVPDNRAPWWLGQTDTSRSYRARQRTFTTMVCANQAHHGHRGCGPDCSHWGAVGEELAG